MQTHRTTLLVLLQLKPTMAPLCTLLLPVFVSLVVFFHQDRSSHASSPRNNLSITIPHHPSSLHKLPLSFHTSKHLTLDTVFYKLNWHHTSNFNLFKDNSLHIDLSNYNMMPSLLPVCFLPQILFQHYSSTATPTGFQQKPLGWISWLPRAHLISLELAAWCFSEILLDTQKPLDVGAPLNNHSYNLA